MKLLEEKQLAKLLDMNPASVRHAAKNEYLVKKKYRVAEWANWGDDDGRLINYKLPEDVYRELKRSESIRNELGENEYPLSKSEKNYEERVREEADDFISQYNKIIKANQEDRLSDEELDKSIYSLLYELFGIPDRKLNQTFYDLEPGFRDTDCLLWAQYGQDLLHGDISSYEDLLIFMIKRRDKQNCNY